MQLRFLGIATGLLAFACAAFAYPTISGPSGGAALPTASLTPSGQVQIAADYYDTDGTYDMSSFVSGINPYDGVRNAYPLRALIGFGDFEIGGNYDDQKINGTNVDGWGANLKFGTPLKLAGVYWAAGASYNTASIDEYFNGYYGYGKDKPKTYEGYLVGDYNLPLGSRHYPLLTGTLGVNWVRFDDEGIIISEGGRGMAALAANLTRKLKLGIEYQTSRKNADVKPISSIYARYQVASVLGVQVGYTNVSPDLGEIGLNQHKIFAGLELAFGGRRAPAVSRAVLVPQPVPTTVVPCPPPATTTAPCPPGTTAVQPPPGTTAIPLPPGTVVVPNP